MKIVSTKLTWLVAVAFASFIIIPSMTFAAPPNPLSGYTIHLTAPHMMDEEVIGPFHHYCKPINQDVIQCVLFEQ